MTKNLKNLLISTCALFLIIGVALKYCTKNESYSKQYIDNEIMEYKISDSAYKDTLEFVRGLLALKDNQLDASRNSIISLESDIDSLINNHNKTKSKLVKPSDPFYFDTSFVLAPNEYVNECEGCFKTLGDYKKQNIQYRFERDSYDSLMRQQARIQESQIFTLQSQRTALILSLGKSEEKRIRDSIGNLPARKVKLSAMGMLNDLFIPNGGGPGVIYEDKKFNEFGAHVLFNGKGNIYLIHIAKTISFRKKR